MKKIPLESLLEAFDEMPDPRIDRTKKHELVDILAIAICGTIAGAEGWVAVEEFGLSREQWFRTFLSLPNGIPSHDTFGRVFSMLDPKAFTRVFTAWMAEVAELTLGEVVAIDGKTLRRSHDRSAGKSAVHMVSLWAAENGMVLGQVATDQKSNEITAIPKLLETVEIGGCIVTIDAMGCQKKIAEKVREKKADYLFGLKGNQSGLHRAVEEFFQDCEAHRWEDTPYTYDESVEGDHGRVETRKVWVTSAIDWLTDRKDWKDLQSVVMVEATRETEGKSSCERRFYITSMASDAAYRVGAAIRAHWTIENSLHWSLDISFREDDCRVRAGYAAQNFAILRHIALNMLKAEKTAKVGIRNKRLKAGWDNNYHLRVLATGLSGVGQG